MQRRACSFRLFVLASVLWVAVPVHAALSQSQKDLLQDPGGWEYLSIEDVHNGFKTAHVCFDEQTGRGKCKGTLLLRPDMSFAENITVDDGVIDRHGSYEWTDDGILFRDEMGNKDGPYVISIDDANKVLQLVMPDQAGVDFKIRLQLEKAFRARRPNKPQGQ